MPVLVFNRNATSAGSDEFGVVFTIPIDNLDVSTSSPTTIKTAKLSSSASTLLGFLKTLITIIDLDTQSTRSFGKNNDKNSAITSYLLGNTTTSMENIYAGKSKAIGLKKKPLVVSSTQTNFPSSYEIQQEEFPSNFINIPSNEGLVTKIKCRTTQPPQLTLNTQRNSSSVYTIQQTQFPSNLAEFLSKEDLVPMIKCRTTQAPYITFQQHNCVTIQKPTEKSCLSSLLRAVTPTYNLSLNFLKDLLTQAQNLVGESTFDIPQLSSTSDTIGGILGLELEETTQPSYNYLHSRNNLSVKRQSGMADLHLINWKNPVVVQRQGNSSSILPISINATSTTQSVPQSSLSNDSSTELTPVTEVESPLFTLSPEDPVCSYSFIYLSQTFSEKDSQLSESTTPGMDYVVSKMLANKTILDYLTKLIKNNNGTNLKLSSELPTEKTSTSVLKELSTISANLNNNSQNTPLLSSSTNSNTVQKQNHSLQASLLTTNSQTVSIASTSTLNTSPLSTTTRSSDVISTSSSLNTKSSRTSPKLEASTSQQTNSITLLTTTSTNNVSTVKLESSTQNTTIAVKRVQLNDSLSHVKGKSIDTQKSTIRNRQPSQYLKQVQLPPRILPGRLFETFWPEPFIWRKLNPKGLKLNKPRTINPNVKPVFASLPISKAGSFKQSIKRPSDSNRRLKYNLPLYVMNNLVNTVISPKRDDKPDLVVYRMPFGGIEQLEAPFVQLNQNKLRVPIRIQIPFENNRPKAEKYKMQFPRLAQYYDNWKSKEPVQDKSLYNQFYNDSLIRLKESNEFTVQYPQITLKYLPEFLIETTTYQTTIDRTAVSQSEILRRLAFIASSYYKSSTNKIVNTTPTCLLKKISLRKSNSTVVELKKRNGFTEQFPMVFLRKIPKVSAETTTYRLNVGRTSQTLDFQSEILRRLDLMVSAYYKTSTTKIIHGTSTNTPKWLRLANDNSTSIYTTKTSTYTTQTSTYTKQTSPYTTQTLTYTTQSLPYTTQTSTQTLPYTTQTLTYKTQTSPYTTETSTSTTQTSPYTTETTWLPVTSKSSKLDTSDSTSTQSIQSTAKQSDATQILKSDGLKTTSTATLSSKDSTTFFASTILPNTTTSCASSEPLSTEAFLFKCKIGEFLIETAQPVKSTLATTSSTIKPVSNNSPSKETSKSIGTTLPDQTTQVSVTNSNSPKTTLKSMPLSTENSITSTEKTSTHAYDSNSKETIPVPLIPIPTFAPVSSEQTSPSTISEYVSTTEYREPDFFLYLSSLDALEANISGTNTYSILSNAVNDMLVNEFTVSDIFLVNQLPLAYNVASRNALPVLQSSLDSNIASDKLLPRYVKREIVTPKDMMPKSLFKFKYRNGSSLRRRTADGLTLTRLDRLNGNKQKNDHKWSYYTKIVETNTENQGPLILPENKPFFNELYGNEQNFDNAPSENQTPNNIVPIEIDNLGDTQAAARGTVMSNDEILYISHLADTSETDKAYPKTCETTKKKTRVNCAAASEITKVYIPSNLGKLNLNHESQTTLSLGLLNDVVVPYHNRDIDFDNSATTTSYRDILLDLDKERSFTHSKRLRPTTKNKEMPFLSFLTKQKDINQMFANGNLEAENPEIQRFLTKSPTEKTQKHFEFTTNKPSFQLSTNKQVSETTKWAPYLEKENYNLSPLMATQDPLVKQKSFVNQDKIIDSIIGHLTTFQGTNLSSFTKLPSFDVKPLPLKYSFSELLKTTKTGEQSIKNKNIFDKTQKTGTKDQTKFSVDELLKYLEQNKSWLSRLFDKPRYLSQGPQSHISTTAKTGQRVERGKSQTKKEHALNSTTEITTKSSRKKLRTKGTKKRTSKSTAIVKKSTTKSSVQVDPNEQRNNFSSNYAVYIFPDTQASNTTCQKNNKTTIETTTETTLLPELTVEDPANEATTELYPNASSKCNDSLRRKSNIQLIKTDSDLKQAIQRIDTKSTVVKPTLLSSIIHDSAKLATTRSYSPIKSKVMPNDEVEDTIFQKLLQIFNQPNNFIQTKGDIELFPHELEESNSESQRSNKLITNPLTENESESSKNNNNVFEQPNEVVALNNIVVEFTFPGGGEGITNDITNLETTRGYIPTKLEATPNFEVEDISKQPLPRVSYNAYNKRTKLNHTNIPYYLIYKADKCRKTTHSTTNCPTVKVTKSKIDNNKSEQTNQMIASTISGNITNDISTLRTTRRHLPKKSKATTNYEAVNIVNQTVSQTNHASNKHNKFDPIKSDIQSTPNCPIDSETKSIVNDSNVSEQPNQISSIILSDITSDITTPRKTRRHKTKKSKVTTNNEMEDLLNQPLLQTSSQASHKKHKFDHVKNGMNVTSNYLNANETECIEIDSNAPNEPIYIVTPSITVLESTFPNGNTKSAKSRTTRKYGLKKSKITTNNEMENTENQLFGHVSLEPSSKDLENSTQTPDTLPSMIDNECNNDNSQLTFSSDSTTKFYEGDFTTIKPESSTDLFQTQLPPLSIQDEIPFLTTENDKPTYTTEQNSDLKELLTKKVLENTDTTPKSVQEVIEGELDYFTTHSVCSNQSMKTTTTQKSLKTMKSSHHKGLKKVFSNWFKKRKHKSTKKPNQVTTSIEARETPGPKTATNVSSTIDIELKETECEYNLKTITEPTTLIFNTKGPTRRGALTPKQKFSLSNFSFLLKITEPHVVTKRSRKSKVKARKKTSRLPKRKRFTRPTVANIAPLRENMLMPNKLVKKRSTKVKTVRDVNSFDLDSFLEKLQDVVSFLQNGNVYSRSTVNVQSKKEATSSATASDGLLTSHQGTLHTYMSVPVNLMDSNATQSVPLSSSQSQPYNLHISLPVYPLDSTASLESYEKYYSTTTTTGSNLSRIMDDEASDNVLNSNAFRSMRYEDFRLLTEFTPTTTAETASPTIIQKNHSMNKKENSVNITHNENDVKNSQMLPLFAWNDSNSTGLNRKTTRAYNPVLVSFENRSINRTRLNPITNLSAFGEFANLAATENPYNVFSSVKTYLTDFSNLSIYSTCQLHDYQARNNCICSIDSLIKDLRSKFTNNPIDINMDNYSCPILSAVNDGIIVGNESIPQIVNRRRGILSYFELVRKRDTIENRNIEKVLNEQFDFKNTETEIFATPGMKVEIPCFDTMKQAPEKITKYVWTFTDNQPLTDSKVQESGGTLTIENLSSQDDGNYTCTVQLDENNSRKYEHHLSIISLPTYTITATIVYNTTNKCEDADLDILSLYLPNVFGGLLCGDYFKACKIEVQDPICSNERVPINMSVLIEPINVIMPMLNTMLCDFNCQMRVYTRIVQFVVYNLESLEKIPVYFRLSFRKQSLYPINSPIKKVNRKAATELPKLNVACPPGFGYHKKPHICGSCGRNMFSRGDETRCINCPAGQYQPMVGSKSCLKCTNPLQDPYCLRIVYSNAQQFTMTVAGVIFAVVIIVTLICCCSSKKRNRDRYNRDLYYKSKRKRHQRDIDVENQDEQPLLNQPKGRRNRGRKPPEPPPPDFF